MIWFKKYDLNELSTIADSTMVSHLAIEFVEIGDDYLSAKMPVDKRTIQPAGILHGGASVALAETIGSVASSLTINPEKYFCVGLEINANHIKSVKNGFVTGTGKPIHLGRSTQIWEIKIVNDDAALIAISRITLAILEKKL
ncbi:MAG: hotdog fold thioesterase [Calditrichaeota bacterium]|nr:MAG: hotdog fold thioesterase [Calditrichota bacterium]MBL1204066.1 hotdog fold thioesterase [Calditrichota bacterium]NOG43897.1 hotdog fold thioesterase [Calditrichota bacterium]